jgi:hypothetical protein
MATILFYKKFYAGKLNLHPKIVTVKVVEPASQPQAVMEQDRLPAIASFYVAIINVNEFPEAYILHQGQLREAVPDMTCCFEHHDMEGFH